MTRLFVLLQASLLAATACIATANEEPVRCTPDLVQDYDFTMDGHIGRVEFLQLIEDLAPPSCNVVGVWQAKNSFQSTLEDLSCLGNEDGNCSIDSQKLFAVQGVHDQAYDQAVCELIDQVIRLECVSEEPPEEEEDLQSQPTATPPLRKATPANVASAGAFIACVLLLCVLFLFQFLATSTDTDTVRKQHLRLLEEQRETFDASMETTSTTPYVQIV